MTHEVQIRFLNDFDILGVGGLRKKEILSSPNGWQNSLVLQCHAGLIPAEQKSFYDEVLAETLAWLKPLRTQWVQLEEPPEQFLTQILTREFEQIFQKTSQLLGKHRERIFTEYLQEFPWQGPLLSDHFRYLPAFLKQTTKNPELFLTAQKEWLWCFLSYSNFGWPRPEAKVLHLNPSLQVLTVPKSLGDFHEGLYVLFSDPASSTVREHRLDIIQAEIIDVLSEERKFSRQQLLEQLEGPQTSQDDSSKKLSNLIELGIILDN